VIRFYVLRLSLAAVAVGLLVPALSAQDKKRTIETIGPKELIVDGDHIHTLLAPDRIPAIHDPEFLSAADADAVYAADEPVLGVLVNGEAHAYSLWHLDRHEIVNDVVGGQHIAATW